MPDNNIIFLIHNCAETYEQFLKPLAKEMKLPLTAVDILLFLAKYPEYCTAKDISRCRSIKPNLVSVNVEKLVSENYLSRKSIEGDRRQIRLVCTEKATSFIQKGLVLQQQYLEYLSCGLSEEDITHFGKCLQIISANANSSLGR